MNNQKPDISPHLAEYYYILSKHKWIIIGSLIIMVTLTMFFTFRMKPVYRATATLVIDKEQSKSPLTGERMDYESYVSQSLTFNTHFKLITSRQVLEEVIRRLKLNRQDEDIEVNVNVWKSLLAQVKENIRLLLDQEEKVLIPEEQLTGTVKTLHGNLDIEEVMDTRLLKISVEDHDPALAMDIANSLAVAYIEFNIGNRLKSSKNTLSWMSDQLYEMKKKLEDSEEAFLAYKQRENLFSVEGKQQSIAQKIADFNDAQLEARNKRLEVNAKLQQLKLSLASGVGQMDVRSLITNPRIDNLNTQLLDAEVELSRLGKVYKSKHPKIVQITTKIDKTKKKLIQEVQKELKSLEAEGAVLLAREKAMEKTIADFDQEALSTNRKELKYSILQRSVTTNQKLYDTLLSKVEESNVVKDADVSNIRVVERAVLPLSPIKPKKKLNLALSIIFGLMTGVGLAFLLEYMDRSLRTEEDVQRYMDLAVLTVVPEADKGKSKTYGALGK
jgi:polysaccharide biosynthesis transport protein